MWRELFGTLLLSVSFGAMPAIAGPGARTPSNARTFPAPGVVLVEARVDGRPEVTGGLRRGLSRVIGGLENCQRSVRRFQPGAVGRLAVEVTIGAKGRVLDIQSTRSTTVGAALLDCSRKVFRQYALAGWSEPHRIVASAVFDFVLRGSVPRGTVAAGGLTKSLVAGVIQAHLPELAPCVPTGRTLRMILSGVIRFNGKVRRVRVSGRRIPRAVRACVASKAKSWVFPFGKGGHRTWFQFPARVTGGAYQAPRPPATVAAGRHVGSGGASPLVAAGSDARPATARHGHGRVTGHEQARPSPKVGLVEVKVGATFIPGDVDSKVLNRRLGRILKRMKKCGGLVPGISYKMFLQVDRKGAVRLVPVTGLAVPKVGLRCLTSAVAHVTFPVSSTRAHGYQITVSVRGLEGASVRHRRPTGRRHRRRRR